jgi:broad specificity phosphatase PhoE
MAAHIPPADWRLSGRGFERAKALASRITPQGVQHIYSSVELKAMRTADAFREVLRVPLVPVLGLHEHERTGVHLLAADVFDQTMRKFFSQPSVCVFGDESADAARLRFEQALLPLLSEGDGDIVVVTHGTVLTLTVADKCGMDPFQFWKQLGLPSAVSLTLPDMMLDEVTNVD